MATDRELVLAAQGGDAGAFEDLVRQYARVVWATVAGSIRDRSWIEDLVQETFLRCWKSIEQLEDADSFRPWMLSTARRLAFRHNEVSGRPLPPERAPQPVDGDPEDPDEAVEVVSSAIQRLPERYRMPITLRYIHELNYRKISHELQLSNGALRGLLNRGVKLLKHELQGYWRSQREQ